MWNDEKKFGKFVAARLRAQAYECMRIESASTISGCPDLYVQGHGDDYFIELKNIKGKKLADFSSTAGVKIPWRPGQQAWGQSYKIGHAVSNGDGVLRSKCSWTFVGVDDGIVCIRMNRYYHTSTVTNWGDPNVLLWDRKSFDPHRILSMNTYRFACFDEVPVDEKVMRSLRAAVRYMLKDIDDDVDMPCFEDIKDEVLDKSEYPSSRLLTEMEQVRLYDTAVCIVESYLKNERQCHGA